MYRDCLSDMNLRQSVLEYIRKENMIEKGDHVLAGVSGGADSVCLFILLHSLMKELDFKLSVLHVNHGIRQEASCDADFVRNLCSQHNIPCFIEEVDVPALSKEMSVGEEEAGRFARYDLFYKKMDEIGASKLAIAHNMNDQAETFIMNLARGSGLRGLSGIRAVRDRIIRPLLLTSREDIEVYLKENNISFMTDATNLEDEHTRNRIRHHVLPYLEKEINSETLLHISSAANELSYAQEYMEMQAGKWLKDRKIDLSESKRPPVIDLKELRTEPYIIRKYIIMELLNLVTSMRKDITGTHIEAIDKLCMNKSGSEELHLPYGIRVLRAYDDLKIVIFDENDETEDRDDNGDEYVLEFQSDKAEEAPSCDDMRIKNESFFSYNGTDYRARLYEIPDGKAQDFISKVPRLPYTKWFDYDKILSCPTFRFRKPGDYIVVDRQGHKKSLKKFMTDAKIPEKSRNSVVLLADGDNIMWAIGHRSSCAYEISENTKHILEIDALSVN